MEHIKIRCGDIIADRTVRETESETLITEYSRIQWKLVPSAFDGRHLTVKSLDYCKLVDCEYSSAAWGRSRGSAEMQRRISNKLTKHTFIPFLLFVLSNTTKTLTTLYLCMMICLIEADLIESCYFTLNVQQYEAHVCSINVFKASS